MSSKHLAFYKEKKKEKVIHKKIEFGIKGFKEEKKNLACDHHKNDL